VTEQQLLEIVERKTAYLFSGCTKLPALAAGMNHGSAERLGEIGKSLGMAFQLVDDLLDLTSTKDVLGKPVANDLKEGKMTLPVLFAIRNGNREDTLKVQQVLDDRDFLSVDRAEILRLVEQSEGLGRTRKLAEEYAHRAIQMLSEFPPSIYREAMVRIPEFILNRSA
jgi:octaprenyl-diphosphate synthase